MVAALSWRQFTDYGLLLCDLKLFDVELFLIVQVLLLDLLFHVLLIKLLLLLQLLILLKPHLLKEVRRRSPVRIILDVLNKGVLDNNYIR